MFVCYGCFFFQVIYCRLPMKQSEEDEINAAPASNASVEECEITSFIEKIVSISHFLLAINSSSNFIIYTWRGENGTAKYRVSDLFFLVYRVNGRKWRENGKV